MKDLREAFDRVREMYRLSNERIGNVAEFIIEYRWFGSADELGRMSWCLRVGKERTVEEYRELLSEKIGKPLDIVIEELIDTGDITLREPVLSLLNLFSKPFNSEEKLKSRGIIREAGLSFPHSPEGKRVGIIGYGLYNDFFLGKCREFHAFDLRPEKGLLSYRIGRDSMEVYPKGIHWHLGKNAVEYRDELEKLDIVIMTGCTIVNDSYREILEICKNAEIRGIYGPSCELCPDYLFDLGFNYIFSGSVKDKEAYLEAQLAPLPEGMDLKYMELYILSRENRV